MRSWVMDGIVLFRLHTIFGVPLKQNPGVLNTPLTLSLPLPALLGDPYPHWRVGFFEGKGKGTPILPGGYPCQTLLIQADCTRYLKYRQGLFVSILGVSRE